MADMSSKGRAVGILAIVRLPWRMRGNASLASVSELARMLSSLGSAPGLLSTELAVLPADN
jgi:hypothetical protein